MNHTHLSPWQPPSIARNIVGANLLPEPAKTAALMKVNKSAMRTKESLDIRLAVKKFNIEILTKTKTSIKAHRNNLKSLWINKYLRQYDPDHYILSKWNNAN